MKLLSFGKPHGTTPDNHIVQQGYKFKSNKVPQEGEGNFHLVKKSFSVSSFSSIFNRGQKNGRYPSFWESDIRIFPVMFENSTAIIDDLCIYKTLSI